MEEVNQEQTRLSLICELQGKAGSTGQASGHLRAADHPVCVSAKLKESRRDINLDSSH